MQVVCPICKKILNHNDRVKKTDKFICPSCKTEFEVNEDGRVKCQIKR